LGASERRGFGLAVRHFRGEKDMNPEKRNPGTAGTVTGAYKGAWSGAERNAIYSVRAASTSLLVVFWSDFGGAS
jgi:hypothetical protein